MTQAQIEIQLILMLVAATCVLPGVFLVLRKMALISDAISHAILPGIVVGFLVTQNLASPWLILLATVTGVLTVVLVEYIQKTNLVKEDTAIGLVFPALFSIGVLMIAKAASDIHLDVDAVLLGEVAFAPYNRWIWMGLDLGPKSLWVMGIILLVSLVLLVLFFKELKLSTFDIGLAGSLGFSPMFIHYGLMSVASVVTVGAFDAIGAILVVAFMIVPPATIYLFSKSLKQILVLAVLLAVIASEIGYWLAHWLDVSIAGAVATVLGLVFVLAFLGAPETGYIVQLMKTKQQKKEVALLILLLHLCNHQEYSEKNIVHLQEHIDWSTKKSQNTVKLALHLGYVQLKSGQLEITLLGKTYAGNQLEVFLGDKIF